MWVSWRHLASEHWGRVYVYGIPWHQPGLVAALLNGISCPGSGPSVVWERPLAFSLQCSALAGCYWPRGQLEGEQWSGQEGGMRQVQEESEEEKGRSLSLPPAAEVSSLFTLFWILTRGSVPLLGRKSPSCQKLPRHFSGHACLAIPKLGNLVSWVGCGFRKTKWWGLFAAS